MLRQTNASGLLLPARLEQAFALVAKLSASAPRVAIRGQELRLTRALSFDDGACTGFVLAFLAQGARVEATAHGLSSSLLAWAFHALAEAMKCELVEDGAASTPLPETHRARAFAYLEAYEADVIAARAERRVVDARAFVAWLALEEHVAVADLAAFADWPLDDAARFYEMLLDSDAVEDVFVSERELTRLLARFRARERAGDDV
jgi:hypothetical protein